MVGGLLERIRDGIFSGENVLDCAQAFSIRLARAQHMLALEDERGELWAPGRLRACSPYAEDWRYHFVRRFARSAAFGDLIVEAVCAGGGAGADHDASRLAMLINLFITVFDGICDNVSELLPDTLLSVRSIFADFPNLESRYDVPYHPVAALAVETCVAAARIIEDRLVAADDRTRGFVCDSVRAAFAAQMESLRAAPRANAPDSPATEQLAGKSAAAFRVSLAIPALFGILPLPDIGALNACALALGEFFGWIDDLCDFEEDSGARRWSTVSIVLADDAAFREDGQGSLEMLDEAAKEMLCRRTMTLWSHVERTVREMNLNTEDVTMLVKPAIIAWIEPGELRA